MRINILKPGSLAKPKKLVVNKAILKLTAPIFSLFFSLFWVPFSKLLKIRLYWFVEFASSLHKRKHKTDGSVTKVVILRVD